MKTTVVSEALAVHPDQVQEAQEDASKRGVSTEFLPDGRPKFSDDNHQRRYCKAYGFRQRNASY